VRYDRWKLLFMQQRAEGLKTWSEPLVPLRVPLIEDLRADPFERAAEEAEGYGNYILNHAFLAVPAQDFRGPALVNLRKRGPVIELYSRQIFITGRCRRSRRPLSLNGS
jgi:hypothetical protein